MARSAASAVFVVLLLASSHARAEFHGRVAAGLGVVQAGSSGYLHVSSPDRIAAADYGMALSGVGPVGQLALGWRGRRWTMAALAEGGWYRGHSSQSNVPKDLGVAFDSSLLTCFFGPLFEVSLSSVPIRIGWAVGWTGSYFPLDVTSGQRVTRNGATEPYFAGAPGVKFWLGGDFADVGRHARLGWRCPLHLALTAPGPGDGYAVLGLAFLFDLSYR